VRRHNFQNFINGERNLNRVIRFSAHQRIKDQSVSEHSFHVALYSMMLADIEEKIFKQNVDKAKLLKSALLHDLEECVTGDIIYNFKHTHESLTKEIKKFSHDFLWKLLENLPEKLAFEYMQTWENSKDEKTIEGKIIEAADKLDGLFYVKDELSLGNKSFEKIFNSYVIYLSKINLKSLKLILKEIKNNGKSK